MLANIVESTFQQSNLEPADLSFSGHNAIGSAWTADQNIVSFYEKWTDEPTETPSTPGADTTLPITEETGSVAREVAPLVEPSPEELKATMAARPLEDFDDSWERHLDITVLPMTLQQYWDAFWADDAPYFVGAYDGNPDHKVVDHTDWRRPDWSLEMVDIHEQADLKR